jgi:serine/threonine protein kinase
MGLSFYEFNLKEKENKIYAAAGTPGYLSPETIDGDINYKMDNFAIGGIIYFMLTGKSPF